MRQPFTLGREKIVRLGDSGFCMRFNRNARKCVVFLGFPDRTTVPEGIHCVGTGFLLLYQGGFYLITARHVAESLGDVGFCTRVNTKDGGSKNVEPDKQVKWIFHPDTTVDLAIVGFGISAILGLIFYIWTKLFFY